MDYKPSKEIRNIRKLHTCKNLNLNVLYLFKNIIHLLIFKISPSNSAKPTLSTNQGNYLSRRNAEKSSPRNTEEFRADDFVYLAYFSVFLREMKISRLPWLRRNEKYVVFNLPGVYMTIFICPYLTCF